VSKRSLRLGLGAAALALVMTVPLPASGHVVAGPPPCTDSAYLTLDGPGTLDAIMCAGDTLGSYEFRGIPDGIGAVELDEGSLEVFMNHEESEVPFQGAADYQDSSVSHLTLDLPTLAVGAAEYAIPATAGFIRFCSASLAGPDQGLSRYTFFTGEESDDVIDVPAGAPYGPDPSLAPNRQSGYAAILDVESGDYTEVAGMGRHNHENTVLIPGGWEQLAMLSTDDTFNPPTSQLYMYLANGERHLWHDRGSLWALQVTRTDDGPVDPFDPQNGANDYLDLEPGETFQGRFIRVPEDIARGDTADRPQLALENWSNENNVFQFIRLEDLAYDLDDPRTVWIADTGASRVVHHPTSGRMHRPASGAGEADNGRIFQLVFDEENPRKVDELSVLADGDAPGDPAFVPFTSPDNMDTSANSLMVQEDVSAGFRSRIWRMNLTTGAWTPVAHVNQIGWESSGIIDASEWLGPGAWLLDVQAHGEQFWVRHEEPTASRPWFVRLEAGQLLAMTIPGT
jgi:hypothetical protein